MIIITINISRSLGGIWISCLIISKNNDIRRWFGLYIILCPMIHSVKYIHSLRYTFWEEYSHDPNHCDNKEHRILAQTSNLSHI